MAKVALLFPGQGAQKVGMGQDYVDLLPAAREVYDRAAEVLGFDIARLCFEGPDQRLHSTEISQPAIFVTSLAALEVFRARHPEDAEQVTAAAGLSLGEYTALVYAGAMGFEDALRLVHARGRFMQRAADARAGAMVAILGLKPDVVERLCDACREADILRIANGLCPGNTVVSGSVAACGRIQAAAEKEGAAKVVRLEVAGAFHTAMMAPADEQLAGELAKVELRPPRCDVVANVTAEYHTDADSIRENLKQQVVSSVLWEQGVRRLLADGIDRFYEVGPGRVLTGLLKRIDRNAPCQKI